MFGLKELVSLVLAKPVSLESVGSFFHWPLSPLRSCPALMHSCAGRPVASCSMNLVAWSNFPFWLCAVQLPVGDPRIRTWVNVAVGVNRIVKGKAGRGRGERGGWKERKEESRLCSGWTSCELVIFPSSVRCRSSSSIDNIACAAKVPGGRRRRGRNRR